MKFPIISTIVVTLCALLATAQAELKLASVNVKDLYTKFYKRFEVETRLQAAQAEFRKEIQQREEKLKALVEEDKKIKERYDPALSANTMKRLRDEHAAKLNEIQAAQQELQTFRQRRAMVFDEMLRKEMRELLTEVAQVIEESASKGGYDILIDSSAQSSQLLGARVFPYVKSTYDITPEVLKQLNAGAPQGFDPEAELNKLSAPAGLQ